MMMVFIIILAQICGVHARVVNRLEMQAVVDDINDEYDDFEDMVGSTLIDNFQKEKKAWAGSTMEIQGVLDTAMELGDIVPEVYDELRRSILIAKVVDKTLELLEPLKLVQTKVLRKEIKAEVTRIKKFRRGFRALSKYMPTIESMVSEMSSWTKHATMLIEHIFTKIMNFKHFQKIWDGKLGTWFKSAGGHDHGLVNKVGGGAVLHLTELLKMLNQKVKSIQFLHEWKKAFKTFEKSKSKVLYFFRKTKFLKLLKTKKIEAMLPKRECLKGRKTKDVKQLKKWFKRLMRRGDRRRLKRYEWEDMDLAEFEGFQEQLANAVNGDSGHNLGGEVDLGGSEDPGWHWTDLTIPGFDPERELGKGGYNRQLDKTKEELNHKTRVQMNKMKRKLKKKVDKELTKCKPVLQNMSIVSLLGDVESLHKRGATKTLQGLFKPLIEMAGLKSGDQNSKLIRRFKNIIPKGAKKITERFTPKVMITVLHGIGVAVGQSCSVLSMGAEKLGEMHNLVIGLDNQISAYKPSKEIKEIMKRTKDIFNPHHVADMIRKYFNHCAPPKIDSPPQGNPTDPSKKRGSSEQDQLNQPENKPTREKGTKEERGEVKK